MPRLRDLTAAPTLRFLLVGGFNTAITYGTFRALLRLFGDRPSAAGITQALAYGAGVAVSYAANRSWTFKSDHAHGRTVPRFVASQLFSLALSTFVVQVAVTVAGLHPTAAWVLATSFTTVANFVAQRYWVFPNG